MSTCCQFHSQDKLNWSFSLRRRTLVLYEFMASELLCQLTCQSGILCLLSRARGREGWQRGRGRRCLGVALLLFVVAVYVTAIEANHLQFIQYSSAHSLAQLSLPVYGCVCVCVSACVRTYVHTYLAETLAAYTACQL